MKINIKKLISIYIYLLTFQIINKGFAPMNIDLRYIIISLCTIVLVLTIIHNEYKIFIRCNDLSILKILGILFICIIVSFFNYQVQHIDLSEFSNLIILNSYNILNIITLYIIYFQYIEEKLIVKAINFSFLFLSTSIFISFLGFKLPFNDYQSFSVLDSTIENASRIRYCGYGIDPNYVCFAAILFLILSYKYESITWKKVLKVLIAVVIMYLSMSRTIVFVTPIAFLFYLVIKHSTLSTRKTFITSIICVAGLLPFLLINLRILGDNISMGIRYNLWTIAWNTSKNHLFIGNGLSSVRSAMLIHKNWYVQSHSTFFQLLCEAGIFALISYFIIYRKILLRMSQDILFVATLIYFIWSFTYETIYLSYTIMIFALFIFLVPGEEKIQENEKKINGSICN